MNLRNLGTATARALCGCALFAFTCLALAVPVAELGDAGPLPASAQSLGNVGAITSISGTISSTADVDMFQFLLTSPATLTFAVAPTSTIDSQLFLFSSSGAGLWANDDVGTSLDAQIIATLASGTYYLAISSWDAFPVNAAGLPIFGDISGVMSPPINPGAVTGWASSGAVGTYAINVAVAPVPEPETWGLLAAGLLAMLSRKRGNTSVGCFGRESLGPKHRAA